MAWEADVLTTALWWLYDCERKITGAVTYVCVIEGREGTNELQVTGQQRVEESSGRASLNVNEADRSRSAVSHSKF